MPEILPDRPDLAFERRLAKALLKSFRAGDPAAVARLRACLPRLGDQQAELPTLADAQFVIARERGFASWAKLKAHIESSLPIEEQIERFLRAVCSGYQAAATRLLANTPALPEHSIHAACAAADADALARSLERDPSSVSAPRWEKGWSPLLFVCASRMHTRTPQLAAASLRCAEMLLDRGADPNSFTLADDADARSRLPALYRACVSNNVGVVRLLIERGADVNDGESTYHSAEMNHRACLDLLLAHGAEISARHPTWGNTPLYFLSGHSAESSVAAPWLEGMRWLLEHGADPNVTSGAEQVTPLHLAATGQNSTAVELLLAHGADPNLPRADGKSAWVLAFRSGNAAFQERLEASGARQAGLAPADELLGACMRADERAARAVIRTHPGLIETLTPEDRNMMTSAVRDGRAASVRLMVALGFDLTFEGPWGGTPLHWAAWFGRAEIVSLLLEAGAPVNVRDSSHGSSPIAWAAHGSTNSRKADDDYCAVVDALIDAGAEYPLSINKWNEPAESMASRRVRAHLVARGFVPAPSASGS